MELPTETHKIIETLKATVETTNKELQKPNVNLTQLWVTVKQALNKRQDKRRTNKINN